MSVGTERTWSPEWKLVKQTMLLTPDERAEWVDNVLLPGAKNRFKLGQEAERKYRMNRAMIEIIAEEKCDVYYIK